MLTRKEVLSHAPDANFTERRKWVEFLYGNVVCMESITITIKTRGEFPEAVEGDLASLQNHSFFCFLFSITVWWSASFALWSFRVLWIYCNSGTSYLSLKNDYFSLLTQFGDMFWLQVPDHGRVKSSSSFLNFCFVSATEFLFLGKEINDATIFSFWDMVFGCLFSIHFILSFLKLKYGMIHWCFPNAL